MIHICSKQNNKLQCFIEEDYDQRSILVMIAPGTTTQQFTVNVTNDNIIECNEMFNLSISAEETTCSLNTSNSNTQVVIVNDDGKCLQLFECNFLISDKL